MASAGQEIFTPYQHFETRMNNQRNLITNQNAMIQHICKALISTEEIAGHCNFSKSSQMISLLTEKLKDQLIGSFLHEVEVKLAELREVSHLHHQEKILLINSITAMRKTLDKSNMFLKDRLENNENVYRHAVHYDTVTESVEQEKVISATHETKFNEQIRKLTEIQNKTDFILERLEGHSRPNSVKDVSFDSNVHLMTIEKKVDYIFRMLNHDKGEAGWLNRQQGRRIAGRQLQVRVTTLQNLPENH